MAIAHSPLRYPGGKQTLAGVLSHLMQLNGLREGTYVEPYAGGAGAAISLLYGEHVARVIINDADRRIYLFWRAVLKETDAFVDLIHKAKLTVAEWRRQRDIYQHPCQHSALAVGFSTFYLNRCNRSGIIYSGGPIGGIKQRGRWKIDARFNHDDLERRIRKIALYRDRIAVYGHDALKFLRAHVGSLGAKAKPFVYFDPPYYAKGKDLYLNHYAPGDHAALAQYARRHARFAWVATYDNAPPIKRLYRGLRQVPLDLDYSARDRRVGREVMILKPGLIFPDEWSRGIPSRFITASSRVMSSLAQLALPLGI